ncbi:hypothetical protein HJC23_013835 [Cyclotella cryptica]|uniref:Secreted protein n=1 Tax=Cyclotella cryptica TaxID=29204 RepID=A0ABD3PAW3_9STRA
MTLVCILFLLAILLKLGLATTLLQGSPTNNLGLKINIDIRPQQLNRGTTLHKTKIIVLHRIPSPTVILPLALIPHNVRAKLLPRQIHKLPLPILVLDQRHAGNPLIQRLGALFTHVPIRMARRRHVLDGFPRVVAGTVAHPSDAIERDTSFVGAAVDDFLNFEEVDAVGFVFLVRFVVGVVLGSLAGALLRRWPFFLALSPSRFNSYDNTTTSPSFDQVVIAGEGKPFLRMDAFERRCGDYKRTGVHGAQFRIFTVKLRKEWAVPTASSRGAI